MRKKIIVIAFLVILTATNVFALSVRVSLTNATKGEKLSDYPFKILAVDQDSYGRVKVLKEHEFRTGTSGFYDGKVEVAAAKAIMSEVNYRGVSYYSPLIQIKNKQDKYNLDINVYEITDKADSVEITGRSLTITPYDDKSLKVNDSVTFVNDSKFTYVGKYDNKLKINKSLYIPMPAGYVLMNANGIDREDLYTLGGGIALHEKVVPGENSILFKYIVKSDTGVFDMSLHNQDYSSIARNISFFFTKKGDWKVESTNLQHRGESNDQQGLYGDYHAWDGNDLRGVKFKILSPFHKGFFSLWQASIAAAFVMIGTGLVVMKKKIYRWKLVKEKRRLAKLLKKLDGESDEEDLRGYYKSFLDVLESRSREIEERLKS
ncbi:MAG TPA: hypothetical protein ENG95_06010 [Nitrospirae bacterium]|nr:hypothetical protein BMS3Abin09_00001 [bacterium BMS3Abin09]GBE40784.1 hypothetical protein BMS3Bbin09_00670 [bacterium BMS3Bbin09]HDO26177.1 hypothetical protein [Nitrospirota bacterium]